jgi:hypothetical protein
MLIALASGLVLLVIVEAKRLNGHFTAAPSRR